MYLVCSRKIYEAKSFSIEDLINLSRSRKEEICIVPTFADAHAVFRGKTFCLYPEVTVFPKDRTEAAVKFYADTGCFDLIVDVFVKLKSDVVYASAHLVDTTGRGRNFYVDFDCSKSLLLEDIRCNCKSCDRFRFSLEIASSLYNAIEKAAIESTGQFNEIKTEIDRCLKSGY